MKKYVNLALAIIFVVTAANAQHVNFGIKAGLNLYNINSNDNSNNDSRVGLHIGLIGHVHYADNFAIQPEIMYSAQGSKSTVAGIDNETNLNYINVPVLFQYMFDNGFRIQAGPQLGILVSAKTETNNSKSDIKDDVKSIDFALVAGVSYVHVPTGFGVDLRYNIGLSDISVADTDKSTNRGIQLGVFYLFGHQ